MKNTLPQKRFSLTRPHCAQCVKLQEEVKSRLRRDARKTNVSKSREGGIINSAKSTKVISAHRRRRPRNPSKPTPKPSATTAVVAWAIAVTAELSLRPRKPMRSFLSTPSTSVPIAKWRWRILTFVIDTSPKSCRSKSKKSFTNSAIVAVRHADESFGPKRRACSRNLNRAIASWPTRPPNIICITSPSGICPAKRDWASAKVV